MTTAIKTTSTKTSKSSSSSSTPMNAAVSSGKSRDQRLDDISSHREDMIKQRQKDAAESKARTLQMYDNMAKSGSAGDHKALDINTYRGKDSGKLLLSGAAIQKRDLVEETIKERVRASEENKKRLLAAYDYAAKTQPAGTVRDVDFEVLKGVDGKYFRFELQCTSVSRKAYLTKWQTQCLLSNKTNQMARPHLEHLMEYHQWSKVSRGFSFCRRWMKLSHLLIYCFTFMCQQVPSPD